jgi:cell filamentation protein
LPGSQIEMGLDEAFKPISDLRVLKGSSPQKFAELAGKVLAELNYVYPFREGNGHAQEAFIFELGRKFGTRRISPASPAPA